MIFQTKRLYLREMNEQDFDALCCILKDEKTMAAYEHGFDDQEVWDWIHRQMNRYQTYGFGLWVIVLKATNTVVGQCGLTMQDCGMGKEVLEIGYLLNRAYWRQGYAAEAAEGCKEYAFTKLQAKKVYSIIRDNNFASQNVAKRLGMEKIGSFIKHYYGMDMPHDIYCIKNKEGDFKMSEINEKLLLEKGFEKRESNRPGGSFYSLVINDRMTATEIADICGYSYNLFAGITVASLQCNEAMDKFIAVLNFDEEKLTKEKFQEILNLL